MISRKNKKKQENNPFYDPSLKRRHSSAKRFKKFTLTSLIFSIAFLAFFLFDIIGKGIPAFNITYVKVEVNYSEAAVKDYRKAVDRKYRNIISRAWLRELPLIIKDNPSLLNTKKTQWVLADDQVDQYIKGHHYRLKRKDRALIDDMKAHDLVELKFNSIFFTQGDSKTPEYAGLYSAMVGSILTLIITMLVAFPIGVMTAIYLEEFADDNKFTRFIEVNIKD